MMKRVLKAGIFLWMTVVLSLAPRMAAAQSSHLTGFQIFQQKGTGNLRLVFELDQKTHYRYFSLTNPRRLVVDFDNTTALIHVQQSQLTPMVIQDIRTARKNDERYRIVFDLKNDVILKRRERFSADTHRDIITLDLMFARSKLSKEQENVPVLMSSQPSPHVQPLTTGKIGKTPVLPILTSEQTTAMRPVMVVIDPGHGGKDPGALGPSGSNEKDVVLAISKELAAVLKTQQGVKVSLTRKEDVYLTLRQRLRIARRNKADIFIAIHADAYRNGDSQGASVYALSLRGASSEAARWLAAEENYSELGGVDLKDKDDMLRSVLINLSQNATISASLQLGKDVLAQLNKFTPLHHDSVEQAPFVVLKSPDIPSVLVETGFLSNPKEEHLLRSPYYQHQLAQGIMKGVYAYFYQQPPPGTFIAAQLMTSKKGHSA